MSKDLTWRSLSEAADYLGVHFTTLRRWADRGYIDVIRTPGGKRKFRQDMLDSFLQSRQNKQHSSTALLHIKEEAIIRTRQDMQAIHLPQQNWYLQLTEEQKVHMRGTGSRLVALMLQFSARTGDAEVFLEEGRRITKEYGEICYITGLTVSECIQTFLMFRRPMMNAIYETSHLQDMDDQESQRLFEKLNLFLDEILVIIVQAYQNKAQASIIDRELK
jgi:excisionase family DNA binding protein